MSTRTCGGCDQPIPDSVPATRAVVYYLPRFRRRWSVFALVCPECAVPGSTHRTRLDRLVDVTQKLGDPVPCVTCGLPVILPVDKRRKIDACSARCRLQVYNDKTKVERASVAPAVTQCAGCGQPAPTGRSDRAYCSNACRQRAYRKRSRSAWSRL